MHCFREFEMEIAVYIVIGPTKYTENLSKMLHKYLVLKYVGSSTVSGLISRLKSKQATEKGQTLRQRTKLI